MRPLPLRHGVLLFAALIGAVVVLAAVREQPEIGRKNTEAMTMTKMKTVCVGRLLVDVPGDALISYAGSEISGWEIISDAEETDDAFQASLVEQDSIARRGDEFAQRGGLEQIIPISDGQRHGKIFVFGRASSETIEGGKPVKLAWLSMHALFRSNGVSYRISSDFREDSDLSELRRLISQFHHRENDYLPEVSGVCLDHAFLADPLSTTGAEATRLSLELPGHPDAALVLVSMGRVLVEPSLLERSAKSEIKRKYASRFHFLRQQKRPIAEWIGDEQVRRVHELNGVAVHSAFWEFPGSKDDVLKPHISLEFRTGLSLEGEPINSSFSDDELLAWWDRVSSTLRIRPRSGSEISN